MATLVELKVEVEKKWGSKMRMSFVGGLEAHLIAKELVTSHSSPEEGNVPQQNDNFTGEHEIGVILDPPRPFPIMWSGRRVNFPSDLFLIVYLLGSIDGPSLTKETDVTTLLSHNVTVGLGRGLYPSQLRNTRFNMAWACTFLSLELVGTEPSRRIERVGGGWEDQPRTGERIG